MRSPPLRQRLVLAACVAVATALALVSSAFYVILQHRLDHDANDTLRSRSQAALATVKVSNGRLAIGESPRDALLDQSVWVFQGTKPVDRPLAPASVQRTAAELAATGRPVRRDGAADTRLLAEPVTHDRRTLGTVVAAVSLAPYEHTGHIALIALIVLDAVILLVFVFFARALVQRALRPVAWMTTQATEWSERDLDRRFALGPPRDELTALAATLDALLGRIGATLRHEQHFSAEMAHELRTPLANLRGEAELALAGRDPGEMTEALEAVLRHTDRVAQVIDTLLTAAQREADPHQGTVEAGIALESVAAASAPQARERGIALEVSDDGRPVEVDADPDVTTQILVPIVENALRYARSRVRLEFEHEGESVVFRVLDDGPGVRTDEAESIFDPGVRGTAADGVAGAGLGLALARRLARAAGGEARVEPSTAGGRFSVRLPAS
ncbi:MAG: sensor histidine kinase [Thermoleophilaceae bacterium]